MLKTAEHIIEMDDHSLFSYNLLIYCLFYSQMAISAVQKKNLFDGIDNASCPFAMQHGKVYTAAKQKWTNDNAPFHSFNEILQSLNYQEEIMDKFVVV